MVILEISHLCKSFGGVKAINDVSFSVDKGQILGIIGPNGAGKTTLYNCITGFLPFDSGTVVFNGIPITRKMKPNQICSLGLTRTFQIVKPFGDLTVLDNVVVGACLHNSLLDAKKQAQIALEKVHLEAFAHRKANMLTVAGRKRLELARALATEPKLLLLDEVMAGLNPTELREMREVILDIRREGVTLLVIEHLMDVIMNLSDNVVVIEQGVKIAEGTPTEVSNNPNVINAYFGKE